MANNIIGAATPNQRKLFDLISKFTIDTVVGFVSTGYKRFGPIILRGDCFVELILPFVNQYFNSCATWIYSRDDVYITERFDEMMIPIKNDPIDILNMIVMMSIGVLNEMSIRDVITSDYKMSMDATHAHINAIVRNVDRAHELVPCNHIHVRGDTPVYDLSVDKYTMVNDEPVKISML